MSRILKLNGHGDSGNIQPLSVALGEARDPTRVASAPAVDPETARLLDERTQLLRRLEAHDAEVADLRKQVEAAFRKGEAQGREAGQRAAEDASAARLARLENGIRQALDTFVQTLSGLEYLAPALARESLATLIGHGDTRAELVTATVGRHLRTLEAHSVLHVEVSQVDFQDDTALDALMQALGVPGLRVKAQPGLKSGDCRIQLKLGSLDVGLDQQCGRLGAMLAQMAVPPGGAP